MLVMLFLLTSILDSISPDWTWRVFPESGFKVLSPIELSHEFTTVPTPTDEIVYHQYHGGSIRDTLFPYSFVIDHYRINQPIFIENDTGYQEFFEVTVDQILTSVKGSLIYIDFSRQAERDICIWKASYLDGKGIIKGTLVLSHETYYGLQVFGLTNQEGDEVANKFLSSFQTFTQP